MEETPEVQAEAPKVKRGPVKVLIACNTLTQIHGEIYQNHFLFFYRLGKDHPKIEFKSLFARRLSIDRFRNYAAQAALEIGCDYILFIDDDMKLPVNTFTKLYAERKKYKIIAALNYIRGYPFKPMAFLKKGSHMEPASDEEVDECVNTGKILNCAAIGTAVCLIDVSLFKTTPGPWFVTGPHNTEDIYFCCKAKEHNPKLKIGTHCGVITGHQLEPEVISYHTRQHMFKYEEGYMSAEEIEINRYGDRGIGYIRRNVEPVLNQIQLSKQAAAVLGDPGIDGYPAQENEAKAHGIPDATGNSESE